MSKIEQIIPGGGSFPDNKEYMLKTLTENWGDCEIFTYFAAKWGVTQEMKNAHHRESGVHDPNCSFLSKNNDI